MKAVFLSFFLLVCASAQTIQNGRLDAHTGAYRPPESTFAALPAASTNVGYIYVVTDAVSAGSCSSGGGSARAICRSTGTTYESIGGTAGGGGGGAVTGGTCTNRTVTAIDTAGVPTCSVINSAYVNNTIALTGTDINTSNQVTATHLGAALPVNQGGTGTISTLTGLVRGSGTAMTAAELSGDVTTSGSNAVTVTKINGVSMAGLATGIVKNTTATGAPSIAVAGDFPTLNQNTTGTAANLSGTPALPNGTTATTQTQADGTTKLATTAYVDTGLAAVTGKSVFGGSTGSAPAFSATPTFSLADISVKSPTVFEPGAMTANVTAVTFTNKSAGAKFDIVWLQDGTGGRTVTYGASAVNTCPVDPTANKATTQHFRVGQDGTTVTGAGCDNNETGVIDYGPTVAAPGTPLSGNLTCWYDSTANTNECKDSSAVVTRMVRIITGTSALGTSTITSGSCATVVTTSATGVASTDAISWTPNASIKAVTGYTPSTNGGLSISAYPTSNNVNFDVCNWTGSTITPGAVTLNWTVVK